MNTYIVGKTSCCVKNLSIKGSVCEELFVDHEQCELDSLGIDIGFEVDFVLVEIPFGGEFDFKIVGQELYFIIVFN